MNKERRKALDDIVRQLEEDVLAPIREAKEMLEALKDDLSGIQADEQSYLDNMPESFQQGDKGERAQSAIDAMDEALSSIDEAIDQINNAQG